MCLYVIQLHNAGKLRAINFTFTAVQLYVPHMHVHNLLEVLKSHSEAAPILWK